MWIVAHKATIKAEEDVVEVDVDVDADAAEDAEAVDKTVACTTTKVIRNAPQEENMYG